MVRCCDERHHFYIHTFIGDPIVVDLLLANLDLPKVSKWLNYYYWYVATIFTLLMATGYAYVALNPQRPKLVVFLSVNTAAFSMLSATVAIKGNIHPLRLPPASLFASISMLGLAGLLTG